MSSKNSPDFFLAHESFKNWVLGQNEEDCKYWDSWVKENPDQLSCSMLAAQIFTGITAGPGTISNEEIKVEWHKLKAKIDSTELSKPAKEASNGWWWKSAAAVLLASAAWLSYYLYNPAVVSYATGFSHKKTISLSDGTEIILNSNSHLTTKSSWKLATPREIWLEGEAYFSVKSHPDNPELKQFVVHTKDLDVKVVGTQFNVNTRKNETLVYLDEGKVQLSLNEVHDKNTVVMNPGDLVGYSSELRTKKEVRKNIAAEPITSWKSGYFSFNHTPLSEVIELVESTHGITIKVSNPALLKETITGKVPSENINELVKSMTHLFNLSYTMKGSELILQEK